MILSSSLSFGQDVSSSSADNSKSFKHSLHIEAFGRSFFFGSLNYEYAFTDRFWAGVGLGFANAASGEIERNNDGMPETGSYFDTYTTQMLYVNYDLWKRNKHSIYATAGLTFYTETYRNKYPSEIQFFIDSQANWTAGFGYEYNPGKFFFRATPYVLAMPDPSGWFPPYMPWLGLSAGIKL
jgi:hypothetical protein